MKIQIPKYATPRRPKRRRESGEDSRQDENLQRERQNRPADPDFLGRDRVATSDPDASASLGAKALEDMRRVPGFHLAGMAQRGFAVCGGEVAVGGIDRVLGGSRDQ